MKNRLMRQPVTRYHSDTSEEARFVSSQLMGNLTHQYNEPLPPSCSEEQSNKQLENYQAAVKRSVIEAQTTIKSKLRPYQVIEVFQLLLAKIEDSDYKLSFRIALSEQLLVVIPMLHLEIELR